MARSATRYGVSPWLDEFPKRRRPDFPQLRGDATYPVAIIGGGLTGIFTAYSFAAAGIRVAVLESDRVGQRGAARGAGILQGEAASSFRDVDQHHGRRAARTLFDASRRAVLDLAAACRRVGFHDIETFNAWRVLGSFTAAEKPLAKDVTLRREAGLDAQWLKPAAATRETAVEIGRAAVRYRDWGFAPPYKLMVAFAGAASKRGAIFFERSPVRRVKTQRKNVVIQTRAGTITADTVIVCTGEPTDLYKPLKRHLDRIERYVVVTHRVPARVRKQIPPRLIVDTETPPHLVHSLDDGRMLIAGADQERTPERGKEKIVVQRTGQLMYELSRLYPAMSGVMPAYGWDVAMAVSADEVMYAGPHRNFPRHLFAFATRHDPAQAFLASRILLRHYTGQATRDDSYFAFTRG